MSDGTPETPKPPSAPAAREVNDAQARCQNCGYQLAGLPRYGLCPECGTPYTPGSVQMLEPWPNPLTVCLHIGWPLLVWAALVAIVGLLSGDPDVLGMTMLCVGWPLMIVAIVNGYFRVRAMLRRHLPQEVRTRGPVAVFRAIGTTICVILLLGLVAPPAACAIACLTYSF